MPSFSGLKNRVAKSWLSALVRERRVMRSLREGDQEIRLHLGCGRDIRQGYINIDGQAASGCDLVRRVENLRGIPDASVSRIDSFHLVEHLDPADLNQALREWARVLRPGGELHMELPNLEVCAREIDKHFNAEGYDLALGGIFGYPSLIEEQGLWQRHKWGWTPKTLGDLLRREGFHNVEELPVEQTWRESTKFGRDMHLRAIRSKNQAS